VVERPERPPAVLAAGTWPTNAELIEECFRLGYLKADLPLLDLTYGRGIWWDRCRPVGLVTNDIDKERSPDSEHHEDFRATSWGSGTWPQIAYDPPYAATGGKKTSTLPTMIHRFGRDIAPMSAEGTQLLINDGLDEVHRLLTPRRRGVKGALGGIALVKCMAYYWSGKLCDVFTRNHAVEIGFEVLARFIHVGGPGPQDSERTKKHDLCDGGGCLACDGGRVPSVQQNPYSNYSTLLVLRKK
jgi:hypothetical protein